MSRRYILFLFLFLSIRLLGQSYHFPQYNSDSILQAVCADSNEYAIDYCIFLEKSLNDTSLMFPYARFERVILCNVFNWRDTRLFFNREDYFDNLDSTVMNNGVELSIKQIERLLWIINNPSNYNWSECGSPTPEYEFVFLDEKGEIVNRLVISCDCTQIITNRESSDQRMKYGAFFNGKGVLLKLIQEIDNSFE